VYACAMRGLSIFATAPQELNYMTKVIIFVLFSFYYRSYFSC
jgi:hypothetical protein